MAWRSLWEDTADLLVDLVDELRPLVSIATIWLLAALIAAALCELAERWPW